MRRLAFIFLLLAALTARPPAAAATAAGTRGEPTSVQVMGKSYSVTPFQISGIGLHWDDVKDRVPEDLLRAPAIPPSDAEVITAIHAYKKISMAQYKSCVGMLADSYQKDFPDTEPDALKQQFGEKFKMGEGREFSKTCQKMHDSYLAAMYLHDMVREAVTGQAPDLETIE